MWKETQRDKHRQEDIKTDRHANRERETHTQRHNTDTDTHTEAHR